MTARISLSPLTVSDNLNCVRLNPQLRQAAGMLLPDDSGEENFIEVCSASKKNSSIFLFF